MFPKISSLSFWTDSLTVFLLLYKPLYNIKGKENAKLNTTAVLEGKIEVSKNAF